MTAWGVSSMRIDAGCGFECADVASLPADDAAFHFIVGRSHNETVDSATPILRSAESPLK